MFVIDFCIKHKATSIGGNISNKLLDSILKDIPIKMSDVVCVLVVFNNIEHKTFLIDKATFLSKKLQYVYYAKSYKNDLTIEQLIVQLDIKPIDRTIDDLRFVNEVYCIKCVRNYEMKYSLQLLKHIHYLEDSLINGFLGENIVYENIKHEFNDE